MTGAYLGVDVGGTKILVGEVAEVDGEQRVLRTATRDTPPRTEPPTVLESVLAEAVAELAEAPLDGRAVAGVGVAAAGFMSADRERVQFAPHLAWRGEAVRARLAAATGLPVVVDNDANAAAWAEWGHGAARGAQTAVMVNLGTGLGGALVLGGRLHRGSNGMAGEFGHQQVVPQGSPCACGSRGCWEQYCSGNALVAHVRQRIGREATVLEQWAQGVPERVTGPMVTEAAAAGDSVALQAFTAVGGWLGVGVANLVAAIDPDVVVVGGGVSAAGELLLAPARAALLRSLVGAEHRRVPPLVRAHFGAEAGVVGAAAMAREAGR